MKNKKIWIGMLAIMLVLGMTVIGCDSGSSGGGGTTLIVVNEYSKPITQVKVGPDGHYLNQSGLNITTTPQTFSINLAANEGALTNIDLYTEDKKDPAQNLITIGFGATVTVTLTDKGEVSVK